LGGILSLRDGILKDNAANGISSFVVVFTKAGYTSIRTIVAQSGPELQTAATFFLPQLDQNA
jgi:hypothetical protein